ncbi:MAG: hypothetical protein GKS01_03360 [Alphaproteobacteria bacterium]|nr:hypothetical protein [Alphaproteobacteria bacterium]
MPNSAVSTIVKIAIISLLVGLALAFFDISPRSLVENLGETVVDIYEVVLSFLKWSLKYVLLGAVVVVPIWLVFFMIGLAKKKK